MNKSFKDIEQTKTKLDKSDHENQSLRERLKDAEAKLAKRDDKVKRDRAKVICCSILHQGKGGGKWLTKTKVDKSDTRTSH